MKINFAIFRLIWHNQNKSKIWKSGFLEIKRLFKHLWMKSTQANLVAYLNIQSVKGRAQNKQEEAWLIIMMML